MALGLAVPSSTLRLRSSMTSMTNITRGMTTATTTMAAVIRTMAANMTITAHRNLRTIHHLARTVLALGPALICEAEAVRCRQGDVVGRWAVQGVEVVLVVAQCLRVGEVLDQDLIAWAQEGEDALLHSNAQQHLIL
jgi:hypothetical protein